MLEAVFYFQVLVFLVLLGYAIWTKSAAVFALAGVFSILTGVMLIGDGISYPDGWNVEGTARDENSMIIRPQYDVHFTFNSDQVNMWHFVLLYGGFIWLVVAFVLSVRKRGIAGEIIDER